MASAVEQKHKKKYIPGTEASSEEVFNFPFLTDPETVDFIENHGRIMFLIRGPSGTGKSMLSSTIQNKYENGAVCSADHYFDRAFVPKKRDPDLLRTSHLFCQKKVKEECKKGTNPIVVQNTHIRRWECSHYIQLANQYGYTVIMAITLRKFEATAGILEQTNTKGLSKDYLEHKLKSFEEYIPVYLGWFLCPDDQSYIFQQAKETLANLLEDGEFCKTFEVHGEEDIWNHFKLQNELYCIASYFNHARVRGAYKFYLSDKVQDVYGKCFKLSIQGFLVSPHLVLAVVATTDDMKSSMMGLNSKDLPSTEESSEDALSFLLDSLNIRDEKMNKKLSKTFEEEFTNKKKTAVLVDRPGEELMNIKSMSFIQIAQSGNKPNLIADVEAFARTILKGVLNEDGAIENSEFYELNNGTTYLRLDNEFWLVSLPDKIVLSAVLTGKYA